MFYDLFKMLADAHGVSVHHATQEIGLSKSTATKWKKTGAMPDGANLQKIASYFGVTLDYLLTGEQKETPLAGAGGATFLAGEEQTLLDLWRGATEEGRQAATVLLRGYQRPDNNQKAPNGAASVG